MKIRESNYRASQKYRAEKCRKVQLELNKRIDADVLDWLDSLPNKAGYIKDLIRADMEKNGFRSEASDE